MRRTSSQDDALGMASWRKFTNGCPVLAAAGHLYDKFPKFVPAGWRNDLEATLTSHSNTRPDFARHRAVKTWGLRLAWSTLIGAWAAVVPSTAHAANPACPSGYTVAVIQTVGNHVRSKACYRESSDDWVFQDTYTDSYGATLAIPSNDQSYKRYFDDRNGANNGWIRVDSEYTEDVNMIAGLCLTQGSQRLSCTTSGYIRA